MSSYKILSGASVLVVLFGLLSSFFIVDQTQQALVLQFGEPKRLVNNEVETQHPFPNCVVKGL